MLAVWVLVCSLGYGIGYEGYDKGKLYLGIYTPNTDYGYVITNEEIYLDTVFERKNS